jgi:hypothetical protein
MMRGPMRRRIALAGTVIAAPIMVVGFTDRAPGLKRSLSFWSRLAPLLAEYYGIKANARLEGVGPEVLP